MTSPLSCLPPRVEPSQGGTASRRAAKREAAGRLARRFVKSPARTRRPVADRLRAIKREAEGRLARRFVKSPARTRRPPTASRRATQRGAEENEGVRRQPPTFSCLPRGGGVVAQQATTERGNSLDVLFSRKLPCPETPSQSRSARQLPPRGSRGETGCDETFLPPPRGRWRCPTGNDGEGELP